MQLLVSDIVDLCRDDQLIRIYDGKGSVVFNNSKSELISVSKELLQSEIAELETIARQVASSQAYVSIIVLYLD